MAYVEGQKIYNTTPLRFGWKKIDDFIEEHDHVRYCEALIKSNGDITYACPSHERALVRMWCEMHSDTEENLYNIVSTIDYSQNWLATQCKVAVVYTDFFYVPKNVFSEEELSVIYDSLRKLQKYKVTFFREETMSEIERRLIMDFDFMNPPEGDFEDLNGETKNNYKEKEVKNMTKLPYTFGTKNEIYKVFNDLLEKGVFDSIISELTIPDGRNTIKKALEGNDEVYALGFNDEDFNICEVLKDNPLLLQEIKQYETNGLLNVSLIQVANQPNFDNEAVMDINIFAFNSNIYPDILLACGIFANLANSEYLVETAVIHDDEIYRDLV